jgi:hypothetical protein
VKIGDPASARRSRRRRARAFPPHGLDLSAKEEALRAALAAHVPAPPAASAEALAQRGVTAQLRENLGFWCLDLLGFPWNLSSESSLFSGLRGEGREKSFGMGRPWPKRPVRPLKEGTERMAFGFAS